MGNKVQGVIALNNGKEEKRITFGTAKEGGDEQTKGRGRMSWKGLCEFNHRSLPLRLPRWMK